jgi:hypothetical protein
MWSRRRHDWLTIGLNPIPNIQSELQQ